MDAPGTYLLVFAVLAAAAAGLVLWVAARIPLLAIAVGPLCGLWVILTEASPPSRYDQIVILTITSIGASLAAVSLWYLRWLARQLSASRELLRPDR
jgi:hypothetical protein